MPDMPLEIDGIPVPTPTAIAGLQAELAPYTRVTPVMRRDDIAGLEGTVLEFKFELLQAGGSFKARGMLNRLLANEIPASGVIVASGGNDLPEAQIEALMAQGVVV